MASPLGLFLSSQYLTHCLLSSNLPSISHTVFSVPIFPVSHTLSSQFQSSQYLTHCLLSSNLPSISHTVFSVPIFPVSHTLSSQFQSSQYLTHCLLSSKSNVIHRNIRRAAYQQIVMDCNVRLSLEDECVGVGERGQSYRVRRVCGCGEEGTEL